MINICEVWHNLDWCVNQQTDGSVLKALKDSILEIVMPQPHNNATVEGAAKDIENSSKYFVMVMSQCHVSDWESLGIQSLYIEEHPPSGHLHCYVCCDSFEYVIPALACHVMSSFQESLALSIHHFQIYY